MPQLPTTSESRWTRAKRATKKIKGKATKAVMRSHHLTIPVYDMPLRFRPWFVLFTSLVMILLAFLGFTNFAHALPVNDKLLHFFCLMFATGIFYFIFDVEEDARRIWFWRYAPLIFTGIVCFFFGGILSEVVQSLLPYKEFQIGDIIANLSGSSIGLYVAYYLERYYRHRREISRLYRPLNPDEVLLSDEDDDEDLEAGTQLLLTRPTPNNVKPTSTKTMPKYRLANVWDEGEELFDIGEDSDEETGGSGYRTPPAAGLQSHPKSSPSPSH
ncbi:hypothetical protein BDY19DRAFT_459789 [Irpex rosettiformis]|uniref:Uncharacterized protein n=1 Tax=Irpex rosettiformis TaxID=378272 RepID=A0ACB8TTJ2_9APHY|nr:hypothetical protein BDY19DRAFT_459789 [Irpex rosettiformis]